MCLILVEVIAVDEAVTAQNANLRDQFARGQLKVAEALQITELLLQAAEASDDVQFDAKVVELRHRCTRLLTDAAGLIQPGLPFGSG